MELDTKAMHSAIVAGLPLRARWIIDETPLDYDFTISRPSLRQFTDDMVTGGAEKEWFVLLIFGESDYSGGASAWLGVSKNDGAVYGLDPERENAVFLFSSSLERFIQSFRLLHEFLSEDKRLPVDAEVRLRSIDPEAYPMSEWRSLVDFLIPAEPGATPDRGGS